jgi:hypothetical protein
VLYGLGVERLQGLIPDIVANTNARQPHIREGFLLVFVFLPASFGPELQVRENGKAATYPGSSIRRLFALVNVRGWRFRTSAVVLLVLLERRCGNSSLACSWTRDT